MTRPPYWDVEPEQPDSRPVLGPACELCGDEWELTLFPLWSADRGYWTGTRCVDGPACRARQAAKPTEPASAPSPEGDDSWL